MFTALSDARHHAGSIRDDPRGLHRRVFYLRYNAPWRFVEKGKGRKFFLSLGEKLWVELLIIIIRAKEFANEFGTVRSTVPIRLAKCNYL